MELYLKLYNVKTNKEWKRYFKSEYEMDLFKRKLKYISFISVIEDSREYYFPNYNL